MPRAWTPRPAAGTFWRAGTGTPPTPPTAASRFDAIALSPATTLIALVACFVVLGSTSTWSYAAVATGVLGGVQVMAYLVRRFQASR